MLGPNDIPSLYPGQDVSLICAHNSTAKNIKVTWTRNNNPESINTFTHNITYNKNLHAGLYRCKIETNDFCQTSEKPLNVTTNNDTPRIKGASARVNNGTLITLRCFTRNPQHTFFEWFKNGEIISNTNTSSSILKFTPFKYGNEGRYSCNASSGPGGMSQSSDEVSMTVISRYELCKCPCPAGIKNMTMTEKQLVERLKEIENNLTLDRTKIAAVIYRKKSAEDKRKSIEIAKSITITVFCFMFGLVFGMDGLTLAKYVYKTYKKEIRRKERRKERELKMGINLNKIHPASASIVPLELAQPLTSEFSVLFSKSENKRIKITEQ